jgi:hypothetical protein
MMSTTDKAHPMCPTLARLDCSRTILRIVSTGTSFPGNRGVAVGSEVNWRQGGLSEPAGLVGRRHKRNQGPEINHLARTPTITFPTSRTRWKRGAASRLRAVGCEDRVPQAVVAVVEGKRELRYRRQGSEHRGGEYGWEKECQP